jgi:hypothetical protein
MIIRKLAVILVFAGVLLAGCDTKSPVTGIEESLDSIPSLRVIPGAENARINVTRNEQTSYFTVQLDNLAEELGIPAGEYKAWCAQWDVNINSNNATYSGVQILDIEGEEYWKEIAFLLDHADDLMANGLAVDDEGDQIATVVNITWAEIQLAVWVLINHRKFELREQYLSEIAQQFRNVKPESVERILAYVRQYVSGWKFEKMRKIIYYCYNGNDVQDLLLVRDR